MIEWLALLWFFITHPEAFIFAMAMSGETGFWIVQQLVRIYDHCWLAQKLALFYEWIGKAMGPVFGLPYNDFWVIALIIIGVILCIVFGIPVWWIAISLSKIAKTFIDFLGSRFRAMSISNERSKKE